MSGEIILGIAGIVVTLLGTGSILGYWLKNKLDDSREERNFKRRLYLEGLQKQRSLLLEFSGTPKADFGASPADRFASTGYG